MNQISYTPIGTIHSPFTDPEGMPIQPAGAGGQGFAGRDTAGQADDQHVGVYVGGGQMIHAPYTGAVVSYSSISGAWIGGRF